MQTPDPDEPRRQLIAQLFAADRGKKCDEPSMSAYLLALRRMDTARLARTVEKILDGMQSDTDPYRVPQPGRIWQVSKELRLGPMPPPRAAEAERDNANQAIDPWVHNANYLLLAWITDPKAKRAHRYAPDSPYDPKLKHVVVGPRTKLLTGILRKWSLLWARDMAEDRAEGGKLEGRALWLDYMARADREIDALNDTRAAA